MTVFTARIPIRWTDLDAQGHVNNVTYAEYLQQARAVFIRSGQAASLLEEGCIVACHKIEYLSPITFTSEPLECQVWASECGAARFSISYELLQSGQLCARAVTVLCPFDFQTQSPRRLHDHEKEFLTFYRGDVLDLRALETPDLHGVGMRVPVYTRWSDTDRYGHVNNVHFLDFALAGRIAMTTQAHPSMARVGMGVDDRTSIRWLIMRQDIDYLHQMSYREEPFDVISAPIDVGTTSVTIASQIVDPLREDALVAQSRCILVCADAQGDKQPLPEAARHGLEALMINRSRQMA